MADINQFIKDSSLRILVKPNSQKNGILGYDEARKALKVSINAPPEDNKANKEVIKFFTKLLNKKVRILFGLKSKEKVLRIG